MSRAFIFPGQGSQFIGMGKDLLDNFAEAREVFERVDDRKHPARPDGDVDGGC